MYLLCDIDGVHIPFPDPHGEAPIGFQSQFVTPAGHTEPVKIWLNPITGRLLLGAITDLPLTPLWCSSWRADSAPLIGTRLGLPIWGYVDLPVLPITTSHPNGYLWKRDTVADLVSGGETLIWIDDDFTPADHAWARRRTMTGSATLLIQPDPRAGLRPTDLEPLAGWACRTPRAPSARPPAPEGGTGAGLLDRACAQWAREW